MATVLKESTWEKHKAAEKTGFMQRMFHRQIDINEYYEYLVNVYQMYRVLEEHAEKQNLFDDMKALKRCAKIREDITELEEKFSCFGGYKTMNTVVEYQDHIRSVKDDPEKLLAHMYVRYMGDMSGGQVIKKFVYGSCNFYNFDEPISELKEKFSSKLNVNMADEANIGFDFMIRFMEELESNLVKSMV